MDIEVTNIPEEKFETLQTEILNVLIGNGLKGVDTIIIRNLNGDVVGVELEIKG